MLTAQRCETVKVTVPALHEHGETFTRTFYHDMFAAHPELYNLFNPANQRDSGQARSLAASVLAYAGHIDAPEHLGRMIERISNKHGSLLVKSEHYPIVGEYLLGVTDKVLDPAATPEIVDAWHAACGQLAEILIGREDAVEGVDAARSGGWRGFKAFRVERRVPESEMTTSFYLVPADGTPPADFLPGQHPSVKVHPTGFAYDQIRKYSLSCAPNGRHYRMSVKREGAPGTLPGLVSNHPHDAVNQGDTLLVHMPLGDFTLARGDASIVLLSGGVGITAVLAMLEHLAGPGSGTREVVFLHAARGRAHHALGEHVRDLGRRRPGIRVAVLYEEAGPEDVIVTRHDALGRITAELIRRHLVEREAEFFNCGPLGFMAAVEGVLGQLGVPLERRHSEACAPDPSSLRAQLSRRPKPRLWPNGRARQEQDRCTAQHPTKDVTASPVLPAAGGSHSRSNRSCPRSDARQGSSATHETEAGHEPALFASPI